MAKNKGGRTRKKRKPSGKFATWMKTNDVSVKEMAARLRIATSSVYGLRDRTLKPGLALAIQIEYVTGIPVTDWA